MTIADSVGDFMTGRSIEVNTRQADMSLLHVVARNRATLDSARVRFIKEVEAGKHPRLPRTQPQVMRPATPTVPASAMGDSLDVVLEARLAETGRILKINRLKGSGNEEVDRAALLAAYRTVMISGGEMGMGIPSSMVLHYVFNHGAVAVDIKPAVPPMWREWFDSPGN
jgi:TonB family protein